MEKIGKICLIKMKIKYAIVYAIFVVIRRIVLCKFIGHTTKCRLTVKFMLPYCSIAKPLTTYKQLTIPFPYLKNNTLFKLKITEDENILDCHFTDILNDYIELNTKAECLECAKKGYNYFLDEIINNGLLIDDAITAYIRRGQRFVLIEKCKMIKN